MIILAGIIVPIILLVVMLIVTLISPSAIIAENIGQIYQALLAITIIPIVVILSKATKGFVFTKNVKLKNAREEFEKIYNELLEIQNEDLYRLRGIANLFAVIDIALGVLMVLGAAFIKIDGVVISKGIDSLIKWMTLISPIALVCMAFLGVKHRRLYKKVYKEQIITKFVRLVDKNLKYSLYGRIGDDMKNKYLVSDFEKKAFNRFSSEDYVDGKIDGKTYVEIAELNVDFAFTKKKRKYREDLFKGMFAVVRSEKDIGAWVKVEKNKFNLFISKNKLETDDSVFEKIFDVYTDNKGVANQLLQNSMREILVRFHKDYELRYEIMFRDNIVFMRFFTPAMFEPKVFGNSIDKKLLFTYYNIVKFISEVINEISITTAFSRENERVEEEIKDDKEETQTVVAVIEESKEETKVVEEVSEEIETMTQEFKETDIIKEKKTKSKKTI